MITYYVQKGNIRINKIYTHDYRILRINNLIIHYL